MRSATAAAWQSSMRKLPDRDTLDRLYWIEEMTVSQIADAYDCWDRAVSKALQKYRIPRRKAGRRIQSHCIEPHCKNMVCKIKRWRKGKIYWCFTNRCAIHAHLKKRLWYREYYRRKPKASSKGLYRYHRKESAGNGMRKPLGQSSIIAKDI